MHISEQLKYSSNVGSFIAMWLEEAYASLMLFSNLLHGSDQNITF